MLARVRDTAPCVRARWGGKLSRHVELEIRRLAGPSDPELPRLVEIYEDVILESERKPRAEIMEMVEDPSCIFAIAKRADLAVGFAILFLFRRSSAAVLEYMGVRRDHQGRGVGRALFRAISGRDFIASRPLLLEVDSESEDVEDGERSLRRRRKAFYRALGCREVGGFIYSMPTLGERPPPKMNLLVSGGDLGAMVADADVRSWVRSLYEEMYHRPASDPSIWRMTSALPPSLPLIQPVQRIP